MAGMNITIDDTSPDFVWTSGGVWRAQDPDQTSINNDYFLQTYHATQTKGANVSITFVGSACQIYGSKGPNHGNYSVTFDNAIKFSPGFSTQTLYRQLLFSYSFGTTFDTHTVVLRNEEDFWLDLDFMVLTISTTADTSTSDIGFFSTTVTPATAVPSGSSTSNPSDSSSPPSSNTSIFRTITFVLAGLLGVLLLALAIWFFVYRKRTRQPTHANAVPVFQYGHKAGASGTMDVRSQQRDVKDLDRGRHNSNLLGFGRTKLGKGTGMEDALLMQPPTSPSVTAMGDHDTLPYNRNSTMTNSVGGATARESLIALNNMGKRPGYRNLGSEGDMQSGSRSSVISHLKDTTPSASVVTLGSAGQAWLRNDPEARFKRKAGAGSMSGISSIDSDAGYSNALGGAHLLSNRAIQPSSHNRGNSVQSHPRERDADYASGGIGLGIYSSLAKSDLDHQRRQDLKRSASVASSGIIDRLVSSPPPAVPELPPMPSATSSVKGHGNAFSPVRSESVYSQGDVYGGSVLSVATRMKTSYSNINSNAGALRLQPPPIRGPQEERERGQRERERLEKEQEAAREREEQERQQGRYSCPPPEYKQAQTADQILPMPAPAQGGLQRQGTKTGDIPIAIEGVFGYEETESQESHSVAHAFVQTALHVAVPSQYPPAPSQTSVNSYANHPYAQSTDTLSARSQHVRGAGQGSGSGSLSSLTVPHNAPSIASSSKLTLTPDHNRSYTPDRAMAVPGDRSFGIPAGRSSEDKVWTLDGPNSASSLAARVSGVGMPIMNDRARLSALSQVSVKKEARASPQPPS